MYYQGTGKLAHGFRMSVVIDDSRFVLGYALGNYRNISNMEIAARDHANDFLRSYGLNEIDLVSKNRIVSGFFGSMMRECLYFEEYKTIEELEIIIKDYVEFYNYDRIHSSLKYEVPFDVWCRNNNKTS